MTKKTLYCLRTALAHTPPGAASVFLPAVRPQAFAFVGLRAVGAPLRAEGAPERLERCGGVRFGSFSAAGFPPGPDHCAGQVESVSAWRSFFGSR